MTETILDKLLENPSEITKKDIDTWIIPEVLNHFDRKFVSLASYAYESYGSQLAVKAFRQNSIETIGKGLESYFLNKQHWRSGRKLEPYLLTCLNRFAENERKSIDAKSKISVPVCPACKAMGSREFLKLESGRFLRCHVCTIKQDELQSDIKEAVGQHKVELESELRLRKVFCSHSRKGYRCPDCSRFIPISYTTSHVVSCPYDHDCGWFGHVEELEKMAHPLGLSSHNHISLNSTIKFDSGNEVERQDSVQAEEVSAEFKLQVSQSYHEELKILKEVIETQYSRTKSLNKKAIKKILMYEAFLSMLEKYPEDMVGYLVKQVHGGDLPIQARIFQEFIDIVEDSLPLNIKYQGEFVDVYSLQDPRLDLFTGLSEFESFVKPDGTIPNMTKEFYVGGRLMKNSNRCFIGKLLDIRAEDTGQSLLPFVDFYTFSQIKLSEEVPPGVKVSVKHFRIPAHYEMHGLVFLQRTRRRIVDSVHLRLHGEKRKISNEK